MSENGRQDVLIAAPVALARGKALIPSAEDMVGFQAVHIRELEAELQARTVAASTIANVAGCMARRLIDLGYGRADSLVIPKEVSERMRGTQLTVANTADGDVVVYVRDEEIPAPLGWEDRRAE